MKDLFEHLPPLHALRAFEAASRHLNFRLAAEALGVTQSAVAQQIRGLEARLGHRLFERQPRGLALTDGGRRYAASVRRAFELLADATAALQPQPMRLTVSVTPSFAAKWLIPRLPDFTSAHAEIDLRVLATDRISHFQADGVDLAVRYGHPPFGPGLHAQLLFEEVLVAVASPQWQATPAPPALLHDAHNAWSRFLEALPAPVAWPNTKNIRFNQTSLAIDAAVAGQGLALAHKAFVGPDVAAGRLVQVFPAELRTQTGFYLVWPRRPRYAEAVERVRDWLLGQAQAGSA